MPTAEDPDEIRRRLLMSLGGDAFGSESSEAETENSETVGDVTSADAEPSDDDSGDGDTSEQPVSPKVAARISRVLGKVTKQSTRTGYFLMWMEDTDNGPEMMMWTPETPSELAEAKEFYEASRSYGGAKVGLDSEVTIVERPAEERALLENILDAPEDKQAWIAYGNYLENQGTLLGEYIRVAAEIDLCDQDNPNYDSLNERWSDLIDEHGEEWLQPLADLGLSPTINGEVYPSLWLTEGMVTELEIDKPGIIPQRAKQLFHAAPLLMELSFDFEELELPSVLELSELSQLHTLSVSSCELTDSDLIALSQCENLRRLVSLDLSYNEFSQAGMKAFANSETLGRLKNLNLNSCELNDAAIALLAESSNTSHLEKLEISSNQITDQGIQAIADSHHLQGLKELTLGSNSLDGNAISRLAIAKFLNKLETLDISSNALGKDGIDALAKLEFPNLRTLSLGSCDVDSGAMAAFAGASAMPSLKRLEISHNKIGPDGYQQLNSGFGLRFSELKAPWTDMGDGGLEALSNWPGCEDLETLELYGNEIGDEGATALSQSKFVRNLKELDLRDNPITEQGAKALASSANLKQLTSLSLDEDGIGESGKSALESAFDEDVLTLY
jgi:uncharacterized protein (TIGR02996 family)